MIVLDHYGTTDAGKVRPNNEDALLAGGGEDAGLFAVADGMGGHKAGEVASFLTVTALKKRGPDRSLVRAIHKADRTILACRDDGEFAGMGTTVVAVRFREDGTGGLEAEVAHVGDSRAYLLRAGNLRRLTADHSFVADLVRSGAISAEEAATHPLRNALTRVLGTGQAAVERATFEAWPGDRVVLCSDGLSDAVSEAEISTMLGRYPGDPESTAQALIAAVLVAGGPDNVTVVVVDLKGRTADVPSPRSAPAGRTDEARAPRTRTRELLGALLPRR
jgi:protein phosphatase